MVKICILKRNENTKKENEFYHQAIKKYGGYPVFINKENLFELENCGGILLTGGYTKGEIDDYLIQYAIDHMLPLLGICQGMQSMALYGRVYKLDRVKGHHQSSQYVHKVCLSNSNLKRIVKKEEINVNSYHHETPRMSNLFRVIGTSTDGLIEAIENPHHLFQIGVQWHPERMIEYDDVSKCIFKEFIHCAISCTNNIELDKK